MRCTNFRHLPLRPFTDIWVHIKTPLNRNWYPRSGVVEGFWIYDTQHVQYTRLYLTGGATYRSASAISFPRPLPQQVLIPCGPMRYDSQFFDSSTLTRRDHRQFWEAHIVTDTQPDTSKL